MKHDFLIEVCWIIAIVLCSFFLGFYIAVSQFR